MGSDADAGVGWLDLTRLAGASAIGGAGGAGVTKCRGVGEVERQEGGGRVEGVGVARACPRQWGDPRGAGLTKGAPQSLAGKLAAISL